MTLISANLDILASSAEVSIFVLINTIKIFSDLGMNSLY